MTAWTKSLWKSFYELRKSRWQLAAVLLLVILLATNFYRAATQSISHDEGVLYQWFLSGPWSQVLGAEQGDQHVLHTLLCKVTVSLFGLSAFSLRIPALFGGLLYFYAVYRLAAFLFEGFLFFLAVALLTANPFVLDYLACARGYGLALGFFIYALYRIVQYLAEAGQAGAAPRHIRRLHKAGVALGLSIGCNVIMIFPISALVAAFLGMLWADAAIRIPEPVAAIRQKAPSSKKERRKANRSAAAAQRSWGIRQVLTHCMLPFLGVAGVAALLPRRLIEFEPGYLGPPSLTAILDGLVRYSFLHSATGIRGLAAWLPAETLIRVVTTVLVPAGLLGLMIVAFRVAYAWVHTRSLDKLPVMDRVLLLLGGALPTTLLLIVISRYVFHQAYPELRTAMYWTALLGLSLLAFIQRLSAGNQPQKICSRILAGIVVLCIVQFATQFNTRYYAEWAYCAAGKDMMQIIRADHVRDPQPHVRIGATWQLEPVINFYRVAWGLDWMEPVYRQSPVGNFDYYVLGFDDVSLIGRMGLKPLFHDALSGTALAKRSGS